MATINLGRIKLVNKGVWSNSTAYAIDDFVQYTDNGVVSTYIAVAASTNQTPSTSGTENSNFWKYLAKGVAVAVGNNKIVTSDASGNLQGTSIGSAGEFLRTNSSANGFEFAAVETEVVKLASGSFTSAAANYDLNFTADDTTYAYYKLYIMHLTGGSGNPYMRMKSSGSAVSTNHYSGGGIAGANETAGGTWTSTRGDDTNANRFHLDQTWTLHTSLDDALHYEVTFMSLSRTDRTKHLLWKNFVNYNNNGYVGAGIMGGVYNQTPAVNGVTIFSSSGANLTNCEMYLYGFKK